MIPVDIDPLIYILLGVCIIFTIGMAIVTKSLFGNTFPIGWIFTGLMFLLSCTIIASILFSSTYTENITVCSHTSTYLLGTNGIVYGGINPTNELLVVDGNTLTITEEKGLVQQNWIYKIERTSPIVCKTNSSKGC